MGTLFLPPPCQLLASPSSPQIRHRRIIQCAQYESNTVILNPQAQASWGLYLSMSATTLHREVKPPQAPDDCCLHSKYNLWHFITI
jgi:hypothetical protein